MFIRGSFIYLCANIASAAIPFLLLPVLTRVLEPVDYGAIAMFAVTLTVFSAFVGLSVHGAVGVQYFKLGSRELAEFITTCLILVLFSTFLLTALVVGLSSIITSITKLPLDWLVVGVLLAGIQAVGLIRLTLWQVAGQPFTYGAFQFSQTLANGLLSLYLVLVVGLAWQGRLIGQGLALTSFGILGIYFLYQDNFLVHPNNFLVHLRKALKFGIPLIPHAIGALFVLSADRYIISTVIDLKSAGIYTVGLQIGMIIGVLVDAINKAYSPWLMQKLTVIDPETKNLIVKLTILYFIFLMGLALVFGALSPIILQILAGPAFQDAQSVTIYTALGFSFSGCYLMVTNYIFYTNKTAILAFVTFFSGTIHIGLTYLLVASSGIVGAGQAFAISQFLAFIGTWWLAQKVYPMPWLNAFRKVKT